MTRPQIFGILNVTPDSFSDGGEFEGVDAAVERGIELKAQGADIVDVGGESTRPGAQRISSADEQSRVIPVIEQLVAAGVPVSIDTMNADTARAAAGAGASVINDVSGGLADAGMYRVVADTGLLYVAMHWRGAASTEPAYDDVVAEVRAELKARIAEMIVWGIRMENVVLDPGIGFAKNAEHNWKLLGHLPELASLGHPLLVGVSRKRFLGELLPPGAPPADRDLPTAVLSALSAEAGAWAVRVHDVPSTRIALDSWHAWQNGRTS